MLLTGNRKPESEGNYLYRTYSKGRSLGLDRQLKRRSHGFFLLGVPFYEAKFACSDELEAVLSATADLILLSDWGTSKTPESNKPKVGSTVLIELGA